MKTVMLAVVAFIGTNLDDLLVNTVLFADAPLAAQKRAVAAGKFLGFGTLVMVSIFGAYGLRLLPEGFLRFLGIIPIILGIRMLLTQKGEAKDAYGKKVGSFALNAMLITIADGGDNIGVYIPLFAGLSSQQMFLTLPVFVAMLSLWCLLAAKLASHPVIRAFLLKYRRITVPAVYFALGIYILLAS